MYILSWTQTFFVLCASLLARLVSNFFFHQQQKCPEQSHREGSVCSITFVGLASFESFNLSWFTYCIPGHCKTNYASTKNVNITGTVTSPHVRWGIGGGDFATQDDKPYLSFDYESLKHFAQLVFFSFGSHASIPSEAGGCGWTFFVSSIQ